MNLNPFDLLDSILADYASPKARRLIHTLLLLAAAIVTIYFSVEGDWKQMLVALGALLYAGANKANTPTPAVVYVDAEDDEDFYDDEVAYPEGLPNDAYFDADGRPFPSTDTPPSWSNDPHRP